MPGPVKHNYFVEATNGRDFGWHSREGIFVFSGSAFRAGPAACKAHLLDVPVTLLHLHGVPIPEDYDGRVLRELMGPEFGERPLCYQSGDAAEFVPSNGAFSAVEAEEVRRHLRALGYLD
jgi:hypothetical protein